MNKIPMTAEGYSKLQAELKKLTSEDRPHIILEIAEARSHGDLSENAEYQYAKEQQSLIEGRIADLENKITRAEVINTKKLKSSKIIFGATVTLGEVGNNKQIVYQIVGTEEADVENGKISISSPLARALLGKSINANVEVYSPGGSKEYEVENIEFV